MIKGIGIDLVEIARFEQWHTYPLERLVRVFTAHEIEYCLQEPALSAQRFAARFAAKEAYYKALCAALGYTPTPFTTFAPLIEVLQKPECAPVLRIDPKQQKRIIPPQEALCVSEYITHLSITHTKQLACAYVILEEKLLNK